MTSAASRHTSIVTKIIILLVATLATIMLISAVTSYILQRRELLDRHSRHAAATVERLAFTMTHPLWDLDLVMLDQLATHELKDIGIVSVQLWSPDGSLILSRQEPGSDAASGTAILPAEKPQITPYSIRKEILKDQHRLGTLQVIFDNSIIDNRLSDLLVAESLKTFLLVLLCCATLWLVLSRILLAPLRTIFEATTAFGNGDLSRRLPTDSRDELGALAETFNTMADSIKKQIEHLSSTERKYRMLFDSIQDFYFRTDIAGHIILASPSVQKVLGYSPDELLGSDMAALFLAPEERDALQTQLSRAMRIEDYPVHLLNKSGAAMLASLDIRVYCDEAGRASGTEGTIRDVTETARNLKEVKRLKSWLSDIIDSLPSLIVGVDYAGKVNLWNKMAERFTGIPSDAAHGCMAASLLPQFAHQLRNTSDVITGNKPFSIAKIKVSGVERRFYNMQIYPLETEGGGQAVIRIDDITEQARIEDIMMQTEKMIMVGGLAAGMAHEINNPLGAIMQHAQNIERRVSPDIPANIVAAREVGVSLNDVRAYLEKRGIFRFIAHMREAGARTSKIITTMLKFSSKSDSRKEAVKLSTVLDQVLELATNDYDMKKHYDFKLVQIVREDDQTMPPVAITVLEIEQVVLNIIKNAAQAMAGSHLGRPPRITLRTRQEEDAAVIEIEDNGPGMDESVRTRIFEPFFTTKEVGVGTGLGLSVSYAIITNNHNGHIEVWSQPGQGTRFTISLPLKGNA